MTIWKFKTMHRRTVLELVATGGAVPLVRPGSKTDTRYTGQFK